MAEKFRVHQRYPSSDFDEGLKQFFSEDGHPVNEWVQTILFVVGKDWSRVEISHSFSLVLVIIYSVKGQARVSVPISCKLLEFSSKLFTSMTMTGIVIDHLIVRFTDFAFVFPSSEDSRPAFSSSFALIDLELHLPIPRAFRDPLLEGC